MDAYVEEEARLIIVVKEKKEAKMEEGENRDERDAKNGSSR